MKEDYSGYGGKGGAAGIIGRCDKLSTSMVTSYFTDKGVECTKEKHMIFMIK